MKNYYTILGISTTASDADIKSAFRSLAMQYHPDRNRDPHAESIFKEINEAYEVLSDPQKRTQYDFLLQQYVHEPLVIRTVRHRDPAYRATRSGTTMRSHYTKAELMVRYLPYFHWLCWVGLTFSCAFGLDFLLPRNTTIENIDHSYAVRRKRHSSPTYVHITESGKKFKSTDTYIPAGTVVTLDHTKLFSTVINVKFDNQQMFTGYVYRELSFFPIILFLAAVLGIVFKNRVEMALNASLICGIFLCICLYLLL
ncbi:MAG: DnaJ domain-containing protein [Cyclobacteriaceae bacterium]|nr:DnaJ domain-containing protein [Cyclobacteriaceae bacterium]